MKVKIQYIDQGNDGQSPTYRNVYEGIIAGNPHLECENIMRADAVKNDLSYQLAGVYQSGYHAKQIS